MNKNALPRLALSLLLCLCLSGCASGSGVLNRTDSVTLPPTATAYAAPTGDTEQEAVQTVLLYVPNIGGTRLIAQTERLSLSAARHPAEATLRRLFAFEGSDSAQPLCDGVTLQLSPVNPVEISGSTATVNLASSALSLSHGEFYVVCQAIANTLTQWGDIRTVNVLVSSTQPGLDVGATVPAGCFAQNLSDGVDALSAAAEAQAAQTADKRVSLTALLYFPAYSGKGILAEAQTLSFEGRGKAALAQTLLSALSQGAQTLENVPALPDLIAYLSQPIEVQEAPGGGQRLTLRFQAGFNDALIAAGVPRSVMMAALTYTLTGFVPGVSGVTVSIGEELVTVVVPNGLYEGAGEAIEFADGVMRRGDFSRFLLSNVTLYFGDGAGRLVAVQRPVPYYQTRSARYLLNCLMQGPQSCDSAQTQAVLPAGLGDADLLGVGLNESTMLVNWSGRFATAAADLDEAGERQLIYAIVNTLCGLPAVRGVCFFLDGAQPETLSGHLYLPGVFLKNMSLVKTN
ncbi:MAG: GerMN domain-containing protein [Clostridia bacterium]|nr:GerMN domain-containing protein [Clostridia bacterium]